MIMLILRKTIAVAKLAEAFFNFGIEVARSQFGGNFIAVILNASVNLTRGFIKKALNSVGIGGFFVE